MEAGYRGLRSRVCGDLKECLKMQETLLLMKTTFGKVFSNRKPKS